ncbi:hypothetical protein SHELI_v1c04210 [Spiroplasma helicoides]|uniref:Uncharacterized protein n=1 Tax=Spiroplasma helicoides TaxID=216938 RepID=A0A1B3SKB3_9MOLU|nr:hypothetical protein [Spiroplasma helicoides]AOG60372.1 hypothetical protein SHELI_v1c04210 [Spiroplasma helicoides]
MIDLRDSNKSFFVFNRFVKVFNKKLKDTDGNDFKRVKVFLSYLRSSSFIFERYSNLNSTNNIKIEYQNNSYDFDSINDVLFDFLGIEK